MNTPQQTGWVAVEQTRSCTFRHAVLLERKREHAVVIWLSIQGSVLGRAIDHAEHARQILRQERQQLGEAKRTQW